MEVFVVLFSVPSFQLYVHVLSEGLKVVKDIQIFEYLDGV